ncbi:MAG: hypothetical protein QOG73_4794 [Acetobacteraceae bacterium]|jgi:hypothetical protein|nr:hypothetical protein [Acetobacteraceae bacterium]
MQPHRPMTPTKPANLPRIGYPLQSRHLSYKRLDVGPGCRNHAESDLWMLQAKRNQTTAVKQAARSWAKLWTPRPARSANGVSEHQLFIRAKIPQFSHIPDKHLPQRLPILFDWR